MSRSFRTHPVYAPKSNKDFKARTNRNLRHATRNLLHGFGDCDSLVLPLARELSNIYSSAKDGACNLFGAAPEEVAKFMRK